MSICSRHMEYEPGCPMCAFDSTEDPQWKRLNQEAQTAGLVMCFCGFQYYRTVDHCPNCGVKV